MTNRILKCVSSSTFWTGISTVAIAIFTLGLVIYSGKQWGVMDKQLNIMDNQLKQVISSSVQTDNLIIQAIAQNRETSRLAQQAKRSNDIAEKSFRLEQRAWIGTLAIPNIKPKIGQSLIIPIIFKNTGRTPARNVTVLAGILGVKKGDKPIFSYKDVSVPLLSRGIVLHNDERSADVQYNFLVGGKQTDGIITKDTIDFLNSGTETLYIHGKISYDDIYNDSHWTTFCYIYNPIDGHALICEENNDIDI